MRVKISVEALRSSDDLHDASHRAEVYPADDPGAAPLMVTGWNWCVTAEPVDVTAACPHCQSDRLNSWGTREQVFKDLPMHGKRVGIYIDTKRLRCQACGKTFSQALPLLAENRMMTDW